MRNVCISTLWHPHETSKLLTAGWDGNIKLLGLVGPPLHLCVARLLIIILPIVLALWHQYHIISNNWLWKAELLL